MAAKVAKTISFAVIPVPVFVVLAVVTKTIIAIKHPPVMAAKVAKTISFAVIPVVFVGIVLAGVTSTIFVHKGRLAKVAIIAVAHSFVVEQPDLGGGIQKSQNIVAKIEIL